MLVFCVLTLLSVTIHACTVQMIPDEDGLGQSAWSDAHISCKTAYFAAWTDGIDSGDETTARLVDGMLVPGVIRCDGAECKHPWWWSLAGMSKVEAKCRLEALTPGEKAWFDRQKRYDRMMKQVERQRQNMSFFPEQEADQIAAQDAPSFEHLVEEQLIETHKGAAMWRCHTTGTALRPRALICENHFPNATDIGDCLLDCSTGWWSLLQLLIGHALFDIVLPLFLLISMFICILLAWYTLHWLHIRRTGWMKQHEGANDGASSTASGRRKKMAQEKTQYIYVTAKTRDVLMQEEP